MVTTHGVTVLEVHCDSSLIVNQVSEENISRDVRMVEYLILVLRLKSKIPQCNFKWVPISKNNHADSLANLGAVTEFLFRQEIPVEYIANSSI